MPSYIWSLEKAKDTKLVLSYDINLTNGTNRAFNLEQFHWLKDWQTSRSWQQYMYQDYSLQWSHHPYQMDLREDDYPWGFLAATAALGIQMLVCLSVCHTDTPVPDMM